MATGGPGVAAVRGPSVLVVRETVPFTTKEKLAIPEMGVGDGVVSTATPKSSKVLHPTLPDVDDAIAGGAAAKPYGAWLSRTLVSCTAGPGADTGLPAVQPLLPGSATAAHSIVLP